MAQNKTIPTEQNVEQFLNAIQDERKRKDCFILLALMKQVTGLEPKMWGSSIVGFGSYHYRYESGREGDMIMAGFSPRKDNLTIYNMGQPLRTGNAVGKTGQAHHRQGLPLYQAAGRG